MNTIAPPPAFKRLPPTRRALGIALGFIGGLGANVAIGYAGFSLYTRNCAWIPYSPATTPADFSSPTYRRLNPHDNPPALHDCCERVVPLEKLRTTQPGELTREFCRGVWGGLGYAFQRRFLERKYRALPGRDQDLWDRDELARADYAVGTRITDHFEVVESGDEKITVRCGDSPHHSDPRPSDGLFTMEVHTDEKEGVARFYLKSIFMNTTPEGRDAQPLPWRFQFAHRLYTQLWMETALRRLYK